MDRKSWIGTGLALLVMAGGLFWAAGRFARQEVAATRVAAGRPRITGVEPADGATEIPPVTGVKAAVSLPGGAGVDEKTLAAGVHLVRTRDGLEIAANRNTSGAGDDVVLVPTSPLDLGERYTFKVTADLKDTAGQAFDAKAVSFTTAKAFAVGTFAAAFERVPLPGAVLEKDAFTALAFGPDGLLYAGTFAGMIHRYVVHADGTLSERAPVTAILKANHGPRLITSIAFDPKATAADPLLWVAHGQFAMKDGRPEGADDWTGKLSRLTGVALDQYQDVLVGLPRAYKDHMTLCVAFGPDGAIYLSQGSNTSVGDVDVKWGYRPERKLTAAILRLDVTRPPLSSPPHPGGGGGGRGDGGRASVGAPAVGNAEGVDARSVAVTPPPNPLAQREGEKTLPLDVKTEEGGTYDPTATAAPLTVWATGIRSGFRLLWHRNGHVYTGVNGAAGNEGNTPASPDGRVPAIRDIKQTTDDLLLKLEPGAYYGHPNPARGQYVLAGGNPTSGVDRQEITGYPVGTKPDPAFKPAAYVFGKNYSPNGLIDYHAPAGSAAAALNGCILVTRYSDGKDVLALKLNDNGDVVETIAGLDGFTGLNAPLDLIQDPKSGNLYVAEYRGQRLTLLRPKPGGASTKAQITPVGR